MQISLYSISQPIMSSCESPHHVKCYCFALQSFCYGCEMSQTQHCVGNDWVWFGLNSLLKIPTVGEIYQKFMQNSLYSISQPIMSSCESPHPYVKCLFCPSIMLLWMWDESNTALLAMIGSGLVLTACRRSQH